MWTVLLRSGLQVAQWDACLKFCVVNLHPTGGLWILDRGNWFSNKLCSQRARAEYGFPAFELSNLHHLDWAVSRCCRVETLHHAVKGNLRMQLVSYSLSLTEFNVTHLCIFRARRVSVLSEMTLGSSVSLNSKRIRLFFMANGFPCIHQHTWRTNFILPKRDFLEIKKNPNIKDSLIFPGLLVPVEPLLYLWFSEYKNHIENR